MNKRTENLLRDHLRSVDSAALPSLEAVGVRAAGIERRITRRRRAVAATGAIATVALVVGVAWNTSTSPQRITAADSVALPSAVDSTAVAPPSTSIEGSPWEGIRPGPLSSGAAVVWTGTEGMMVGGDFENGTWSGIDAYNPETRTWRMVSADAIEGSPVAFWSGTALVVIGSDEQTVRQYDPIEGLNFRQSTGNAEFVDASVPWVWTGAELFVWPTAVDELPARRPRAFNPVNGEWRSIAESPLEARTEAASVWTGTEWIVWGGSRGLDHFGDGAAYNPTTDTWRLLATSPLSPRRAPAVWTGTEMIIAAGSTGDPSATLALADGAAYDPATDTWRQIAPGPAHPGFKSVWTGELLIMFAKGGAVWYDPATDQWATGEFVWGEIPHDSSSPVWTGSVVLLLGSYGAESGGATFRPPTN